jgi:nucleoside-diphosphate-sugar epimerase
MTDVFLTGATGFAGTAVLAELVRSGRSVTALAQAPAELPGARVVVGTLGLLGELEDAIAGCDGIVHLASGRTADRERVVYEDILGTGDLIDLWKRGPFVYASTTTVHGVPRGVISSDTPVHIEDWYDCGKAVNEFQLREAAGRDGRGRGISLRPTLFFGRSSGVPDRQYLAWFLGHALSGHALIFDSEEAMATSGAAFVGLGDFGRAVVAALDLEASGAFPIASGFVTWRDLMDAVNRHAGGSGRCVVRPNGPSGPDEIRAAHSRTELDDSAFRSLTGWQPRESLDELVAAFVAGEREAGRA